MESKLVESNEPILPRSAWSSNVAHLRALFKAKKALDRIEEEAGTNINSSTGILPVKN